ncbi:MAG: hypothetical protein KDD40_07390 [Bdellovibrionales bacterium]|nr:hypothetical protein [Bdellovibrionales bacterium]
MKNFRFLSIVLILILNTIISQAKPWDLLRKKCQLALVNNTRQNNISNLLPPFGRKMKWAQEQGQFFHLESIRSMGLEGGIEGFWGEWENAARLRDLTQVMDNYPELDELKKRESVAGRNPWVSIEGYENPVSRDIAQRNAILLELQLLSPKKARDYEWSPMIGYDAQLAQQYFWQLFFNRLNELENRNINLVLTLKNPIVLDDRIQLYDTLLELLNFILGYYRESVGIDVKFEKIEKTNFAVNALKLAHSQIVTSLEELIGQVSFLDKVFYKQKIKRLQSIFLENKNWKPPYHRVYETIVREGLFSNVGAIFRKLDAETRLRKAQEMRATITPVE